MPVQLNDKAERRAKIVEAAIRAVAARGYHQTRSEDIAAEANVSKGTIYLYFESREAILIAAFSEFFGQFGNRINEIVESGEPPLEKLRQLLDASFEIVSKNQVLSRVMMDFWSASMHNPDIPHIDFKTMYADYHSVISQLLAEAAERGDIRPDHPTLTPNILMAITDGAILHWIIDPSLVALDELSVQLFDLLIGGLHTK